MQDNQEIWKGETLNYKEDKDGNLILEDGWIIPAEKRMKAEVYSRVVGYLRPVEQFNIGKQAEFHDRKVYKPDD